MRNRLLGALLVGAVGCGGPMPPADGGGDGGGASPLAGTFEGELRQGADSPSAATPIGRVTVAVTDNGANIVVARTAFTSSLGGDVEPVLCTLAGVPGGNRRDAVDGVAPGQTCMRTVAQPPSTTRAPQTCTATRLELARVLDPMGPDTLTLTACYDCAAPAGGRVCETFSGTRR